MTDPLSGDQVDYEGGGHKHYATVIEDPLAPSGDGTFTTRQYAIKHRLDRYLGFLPIIALVSTLQASWESLAGGLLGALYNGGPVGLVYGFIVAYFGTMALAASFAEMASIVPVAGAQYHWSADLAPFAPAFWGLMQGWITVFAWMATAALGPYFASSQIQGIVTINYPSYVPQRWHATLMMWATLFFPVLANIWGRKLIKPLELVFGVFHIIGWPLVLGTLLACVPAPKRSPSEFVFETFVGNISGWKNSGVAFSLGMLTPSFALAGFDGALHLSEEVTNPRTTVPHAIVWGLAFNGLLAFGILLVLLYTMGDYVAALSTPTGWPIIEIYLQATKSKAGMSGLMTIGLIAAFVAVFGALASVSRLVWAFSRDGGMPFSSFFVHVHPTLRIPLRSFFLVVTVIVLLSLIQIGSTTAFNALLSLSTLALYISYIVPITFIAIKRLRRQSIPWGPFRLGLAGLPINIFAIAYAIYVSIFLPFPPGLPVTAKNMNYAGPVLGAVLLFALVDWCWKGRKRWVGPGSLKLATGE